MGSALPPKIGFSLACAIALWFIYLGSVRVVTNTVKLARWQLYRESDVIKAWPRSQLRLLTKEIQVSSGPSRRRIVIIIQDATPACAIITDDGIPTPYVRRLPDRDDDISKKLALPVNVFEAVSSPALHFLYHAFGSLVIFALGLFILVIAGHAFWEKWG